MNDSRLQVNPFLNENVVTRPTGMADGASGDHRRRQRVAFSGVVECERGDTIGRLLARRLAGELGFERANLDEQRYLTAALSLDNGMFASYTTGKLPLDAQNDQVYEVGFHYKF